MKSLVNLSIILSLSSAAFISCSSEDDLKVATEYVPLDIAAVSAAGNTQTRAAIDAEAFPVADAASIGLFVTKEDGSAYNSQASGYSNVAYNKAAGATTWLCTSPILLSSTQGRLYGYYPYSAEATDATAIPVSSSVDGADYMYLSAPTTAINRETAMPVNITMQHALSRLDITFVKDAAISAASLTSFTLSGDGVATSGTMNILEGGEITATKATSGFTYTPESAVALSASNTYKCLLVPATQEAKDLTISCVINGVSFSKTLTSVALLPATRIAVTLTLKGTGVEVTNVSVTGWTTTEAPVVEAQTITATVAPFIDEDGNPIDYYTFQWQENDQLGIFPLDKAQMAFDVKESNGTYIVDGGSWGVLRPEYSYASYYPFSKDNYQVEMTKLPVIYTGQEMDAITPMAHLGKYDFVASAPQKISGNGDFELELQHLGCLARFVLKIPEPGTYVYLTLNSENKPFSLSSIFDLSDETPSLTSKKLYTYYQIDLKNFTTTEANEEIVIYSMFEPIDLSSENEVKLSILSTSGKLFSTTVPGKNMQAGHAYTYQPTSVFSEVSDLPIAKLQKGASFNAAIKILSKSTNSSTLATTVVDVNIKKVKFDFNSGVSSGRVISVSDSDYPIYANYEDGVITISTPAAKIVCNSDMSKMFENLGGIRTLDLSCLDTHDVTNMEDMFRGCTRLNNLDLSSFNTQNVMKMDNMFYDCHNLTNLKLSKVFIVGGTKSYMFNLTADSSKSCTITCTETTKSSISTGTNMNTSYITWNIIQ